MKFLLGKLADRRLGQLRADLHVGDHLVLSKLVFQKILQLGEGDGGRLVLEFDEGLRRLPAVFVVNADDRDFRNRRMLIDRVFNCLRICAGP